MVGIQPEMLLAVMVAAGAYQDHGADDLVITEGSGGKHMVGSLHVSGRAVDIRTSNLPASSPPDVVAGVIRRALGPDWDVVWEPEPAHIHIEWQPK